MDETSEAGKMNAVIVESIADGSDDADNSVAEEITTVATKPMPLNCLICGKGASPEDCRPMVRFLPQAGSSTQKDISLHVFCGKTAVILAKKPQYEILTMKGLKNKHGIGKHINACISKTRSAISVIPLGNPNEQKITTEEFFLVEEFEANLHHLQSFLKPHPANRSKTQTNRNSNNFKKSYQKYNINKADSALPHRKDFKTKIPVVKERHYAASPLLCDSSQWTYVHKPTRVVSKRVAAKAARKNGFG